MNSRYREQIQLAVRARLELGTSELQVQRCNHSATLPPIYFLILLSFSSLSPPPYVLLFTGVRSIQINRLSIRKYTRLFFLPLFCHTSLRVRDGNPFIWSGWCKLPKLCWTFSCRTAPSVCNYIWHVCFHSLSQQKSNRKPIIVLGSISVRWYRQFSAGFHGVLCHWELQRIWWTSTPPCKPSSNISNTRGSVLSYMQTPRSGSKNEAQASFFFSFIFLTPIWRCLDIGPENQSNLDALASPK